MVQFFTNWELWEELSFVLAAGIVAVFFVGWIKLWWTQRLLKKHVLLDEEKKARQSELRKSGLPPMKRREIPFGVRAIQSGVEIEGIWISRPATPMERSSKSSSTSLDIDTEIKPGDKGKAVSTVAEIEPTPKASPRLSPAGSFVRQSTRPEAGDTLPLEPQTTYSQRAPKVAGNTTRYPQSPAPTQGTATRPHIDTYIPTSSFLDTNSFPSPRAVPTADRNSMSSDDGLNFSGPRNPAQGKYCSRVRAETSGSPFEGPETDRISSPRPQLTPRPFQASMRPTPVRTYTDQPLRTPTLPNMGFEALPAVTFERSGADDNSTRLMK